MRTYYTTILSVHRGVECDNWHRLPMQELWREHPLKSVLYGPCKVTSTTSLLVPSTEHLII